MSRLILYVSMATLSLAIWFGLRNELANHIALGMMAVSGLASSSLFFKSENRNAWRALAIAAFLLVAVMVYAMAIVRTEADRLADDFASRYRCRPAVDALGRDPTWTVGPRNAETLVERYGAVRRITYQDNGLLRYGFMDDADRAVWLPACE